MECITTRKGEIQLKLNFGILLQFWSDCSRIISEKELPFSIELLLHFCQKSVAWDFPGGPMVKTLPSSGEGVGLICSWGLRSHVLRGQKPPKHKNKNQGKTKKSQEQHCDKLDEDFRNVHIRKNL